MCKIYKSEVERHKDQMEAIERHTQKLLEMTKAEFKECMLDSNISIFKDIFKKENYITPPQLD